MSGFYHLIPAENARFDKPSLQVIAAWPFAGCTPVLQSVIDEGTPGEHELGTVDWQFVDFRILSCCFSYQLQMRDLVEVFHCVYRDLNGVVLLVLVDEKDRDIIGNDW